MGGIDFNVSTTINDDKGSAIHLHTYNNGQPKYEVHVRNFCLYIIQFQTYFKQICWQSKILF